MGLLDGLKKLPDFKPKSRTWLDLLDEKKRAEVTELVFLWKTEDAFVRSKLPHKQALWQYLRDKLGASRSQAISAMETILSQKERASDGQKKRAKSKG